MHARLLSTIRGALDYFLKSTKEPVETAVDRNGPPDGGRQPPNHEIREFRGKITSLTENHGMVDHTVFFLTDAIVGDGFPDVGDEVDVVASRKSRVDGWRADCVRIVERQWPDPEADPEVDEAPQSLVGKISDVTEECGYINGGRIRFEINALVGGYVPAIADWVKVEVKANKASGVQWEAYSVEPLRVRSTCEYVRFLSHGSGFLGRDVYFNHGACVDGFEPYLGAYVRVVAVESGHKHSKWRALRVEPIVSRVKEIVIDGGSPCLAEDLHGIVIDQIINFGDIFIGQSKAMSIPMKNDNNEGVSLVDCVVLEGKIKASVRKLDQTSTESSSLCAFPYELSPHCSCAIHLSLFGYNVGFLWNKLSLRFENFNITIFVKIQVVDPLQAIVAPVEPYQPHQRLAAQGDFLRDERPFVVPGQKPQFKELHLPRRLPPFEVPDSVREGVFNQDDIFGVLPALALPLTLQVYSHRFSALLQAEELAMEMSMKQYAIPQAEMRKYGEYLQLPVPGLAERRPSLLVGDKVYASIPDGDESLPQYEGFIHEVQGESVLIKFSLSFHRRFHNEDYHVEFSFNRTPLRKCHQAIEIGQKLGSELLFPSSAEPKTSIASVRLFIDLSHGLMPPDFLNGYLNTRQKETVQRIVAARGRPAPYIVFGPPGTGKTVTLVEAIVQVFHRIPFSRILVTAPSNSAADLLALRLSLTGCFSQGDLARLNSYQRQAPPDMLLPFCHNSDNLETISYYRIVVTTCVTSGMFFCLGVQRDHFTHVFIDEAGQATEPECLIPVGYCAGHHGQCVLAGDPYQLGPVLQSKIATTHGLQLSFLERLTKRPAYCRNDEKFGSVGGYDPCLVTKLIDNYRSHRSILELPSRMFYNAELRPCAPASRIERLSNWLGLPCQVDFPIIFHGLKGEDLREGNSPSWFNPAEAVQALKYALQLTGKGSDGARLNLKCEEIGIITPYRKQVEKIRCLLERFELSAIKVGSVEEFQGQERQAIILSTVRSSSFLLSVDERYCLGFVGNPKRFNVAITRAEALLIVIGDPNLLSKDPYWGSFIQYCKVHNACVGSL